MSKRMGWRTATKRAFDFEDWVADLFRSLGYEATLEGEVGDMSVDVLIEKDGSRTPVEVISTRGAAAFAKLRADAERVLSFRSLEPGIGRAIIALASPLTDQARVWAESQYDIDVLDLDALRKMSGGLPHLAQRLEMIVEPEKAQPPESVDVMGDGLRQSLSDHIDDNTLTPAGFEDLCMRVFMHLFDPDLYGFAKQQQTTDGANRYDFICRIKPGNSFWDGLRADFRTKAILFECKNYAEGITADQVYSTERYLFVGALRTVCFLISRLPAAPSALRAAQGAMRENGKLVLLLSNEDLIQMLKLKSQPGGAENYLDTKIWEFVVSLPR